MNTTPSEGRDRSDERTVDLEAWIIDRRRRLADRLRAAHPELPMVQLPLVLYDRAG